MTFRLMISSFLFFLALSFSNAQCTDCPNTILNSSFNGNGNWQAFAQDDVLEWQAAFGSPSLIYYNPDPPGSQSNCTPGPGNQGTLHTLLFSGLIGGMCDDEPIAEGVFQENLSIIMDNNYSYCMDFSAFVNSTPNCGGNLEPNVNDNYLQIYLANGLVGVNTTTDACLIDLSGFQEIFNQNILNTTMQSFTISNLIPQQDYTQIMVFNELVDAQFGDRGIVLFDDVMIHCDLNYPAEMDVSINDLMVDFDLDVGSYVLDDIKWDFGDGNYSSEMSPSHIYDGPGEYYVCVNYMDENDCCGEVCKSISLDRQCDYDACIWPFLTCSAGGGGLELDDIQVLLPDGEVLNLAEKNESNGCLDCVFNFPYCLFSINDWQDYCSEFYIINDNINGPFYQDLNKWLSLNNYKGYAYHDGFTNGPCRTGEITIESTNVRFENMTWSNNAPPNACFGLEQIVPFTETCFSFQSLQESDIRTGLTNKVNIYPNPVNSVLNIEIENAEDVELRYQLLNFSGESVMEGYLNTFEGRTIQLRPNQPAGIYILVVTGPSISYVNKILIQK